MMDAFTLNGPSDSCGYLSITEVGDILIFSGNCDFLRNTSHLKQEGRLLKTNPIPLKYSVKSKIVCLKYTSRFVVTWLKMSYVAVH